MICCYYCSITSSSSSYPTSSMTLSWVTILLVLNANCMGWFFSSLHLISCSFLYNCIILSMYLSGVIVGFISSSKSMSFLVNGSLACLGHLDDLRVEQVGHEDVLWVDLP